MQKYSVICLEAFELQIVDLELRITRIPLNLTLAYSDLAWYVNTASNREDNSTV